MGYRNAINLTDDELDKPVYRIMPVYRLLEGLESKQQVLVKPYKWDDPFENMLLSSDVKLSSGESGTMPELRDSVYGQCWTLHKETDAMWRIYSNDNNGVKIKSTPRKLLDALKVSDLRFSDIQCFIGKVCYLNQKDLVHTLQSIN